MMKKLLLNFYVQKNFQVGRLLKVLKKLYIMPVALNALGVNGLTLTTKKYQR